MAPPPAGKRRTALGRLADALRRGLRGGAQRGAPPATVPGLGSGEETAVAVAARPEPEPLFAPAEPGPPDPPAEPEPPFEPEPPSEPEPSAEPGARIDAARARLRATIEPPPDPDAD